MTEANSRSIGKVLVWVALAVAGMLVAGCAGRVSRLHIQEGTPWPALCRQLQNSWGKLNTFESELRFSFNSELGNVSGWGKIAYSRAGVLVVRLRGPLGVRAADVVATTDSLWVYVPFRNTLYVGATEEFRLARERPGEWVEVLFGRPVLGCEEPATWRPWGEKLLTIEQTDEVVSRRYVVNRESAEPREASFAWGADRTVLVAYESPNRLGGCLIARLVRVKSDSPKMRLAIAYRQPRVNGRINWRRYRVNFPHSARRVPLRSVFLVSEHIDSRLAEGD